MARHSGPVPLGPAATHEVWSVGTTGKARVIEVATAGRLVVIVRMSRI